MIQEALPLTKGNTSIKSFWNLSINVEIVASLHFHHLTCKYALDPRPTWTNVSNDTFFTENNCAKLFWNSSIMFKFSEWILTDASTHTPNTRINGWEQYSCKCLYNVQALTIVLLSPINILQSNTVTTLSSSLKAGLTEMIKHEHKCKILSHKIQT